MRILYIEVCLGRPASWHRARNDGAAASGPRAEEKALQAVEPRVRRVRCCRLHPRRGPMAARYP